MAKNSCRRDRGAQIASIAISRPFVSLASRVGAVGGDRCQAERCHCRGCICRAGGCSPLPLRGCRRIGHHVTPIGLTHNGTFKLVDGCRTRIHPSDELPRRFMPTSFGRTVGQPVTLIRSSGRRSNRYPCFLTNRNRLAVTGTNMRNISQGCNLHTLAIGFTPAIVTVPGPNAVWPPSQDAPGFTVRWAILLQQGVNPKVVSEHLGHASISFTMDCYKHVLPGIQPKPPPPSEPPFSATDENRSLASPRRHRTSPACRLVRSRNRPGSMLGDVTDCYRHCDIILDGMWFIEVEPDVEEWIGALQVKELQRRTRSSNDSPSVAPSVTPVDAGLFELRFGVGRRAWRITYDFAERQRTVLMTVLRKQRQSEHIQVQRAPTENG